MPTSLLVCESCGARQAFFLDEAGVQELHNGKSTQKHCLRCHTITDWSFALEDRRSGLDRRQSTDRRSNSE
jgi:hypothetical protein